MHQPVEYDDHRHRTAERKSSSAHLKGGGHSTTTRDKHRHHSQSHPHHSRHHHSNSSQRHRYHHRRKHNAPDQHHHYKPSSKIPADRKQASAARKKKTLNKELPPLPFEKDPQSNSEGNSPTFADDQFHNNDYHPSSRIMGGMTYYDERSSISSSESYSHDAKNSLTSTFSSISSYNNTSPPQPSPDQKRLSKKHNIIRELVTTEKFFATDISVILDIYLDTLKGEKYTGFVSKPDIDALKSNLPQILDCSAQFSRDLVNSVPDDILSSSSSPDPSAPTYIGQVMIEYIPQMEHLFKYFCDHNKSQMDTFYRIKTLACPILDTWMNECLEESKHLTNAWTLDALLIKPVQRFLKYPLLFSQLQECTDPDHPDYEMISKATDELKSCADRINSSSQDQKTPHQQEDEILALKNEINADSDLEANLFDFQNKHRHLKTLIQSIKSNTNDIKRHFDLNAGLAETWLDWAFHHEHEDDSNSRHKKYVLHSSPLRAKCAASLLNRIDNEVVQPLETVKCLFESSEELISDRQKYHASFSKYIHSKNPLSYGESPACSPPNGDKNEKSNSRNSYGQSVDNQTKNQADLFIKYHNSLKEGLPDLIHLTDQMVETCMAKFILIQKEWFKLSADSLAKAFDLKIEDIKDFSNSSGDPIVEKYKSSSSKFAEVFSHLSIGNSSTLGGGSSSVHNHDSTGEDDFYWINAESSDGGAAAKTSPTLYFDESSPPLSDSSKKSKEDFSVHLFPQKKKKDVRRKSSLLSLTNWQRTVRTKSSRISATSE